MRTSDGMPWAGRLYRAAYRLMPKELRDETVEEAVTLFADLYRDGRRDRGVLGAVGVTAWALWRLLGCAAAARRDVRAAGPGLHDARTRRGRRDMMAGFAMDVRWALRALAKRPGFALTAILILGTGIGATTTIFSVVDTVVLRPLPYPDAGQLVHFDNGSHSYPLLRGWQELSSFERVVGVNTHEVDLTGEGRPERLPAAAVSQGFFETAGVGPHIGRLFVPADYPGSADRVVISHGTWRERFGADPAIVGRALRVDGRPSEVVGVLAAGFQPPQLTTGARVDLWFPLDDGGEHAEEHGYHVLDVMGRLAPGVGLDAAQAEADAQREALARVVPSQFVARDGRIEYTPLVPLKEATVSSVSRTLWLLLGAVAMLLAIACANVANLFLARGTARRRELALRGALGASRVQIAHQVLTESVLLGLLGGALGVALAFGGVELLTHFEPGGIPRIESLTVDGRILLFSLVVSVGTGVLFGWLPALQATRADVSATLKEGAAAVTESRAGRRARSALVVTEVALAVILLVGGGLLFRTLVATLQVDPGFPVENLAVVRLSLDAGYTEEQRGQFIEAFVERTLALPGVEAVVGGPTVPFSFTGRSRCCWRTSVVGDPTLHDTEENRYLSLIHPITAGYFAGLGAPLTSGREFTDADVSAAGPKVIVNRRTAQDLFGTESVVGRTVAFGDADHEIVGVVDGVHHWGLDQGVQPAVYVPYTRALWSERIDFVVRTRGAAAAAIPALREAVWAIDPDLPIREVATMEQRVAASVATPRFLSGLLGAFASAALLLACGGIYGSMLYTVGQRRQELGIRLALGAERKSVLALVLRNGVGLAVIGVLLGTLGALATTRTMRALLWGVEPADPLTFVTVAACLTASAGVASLLPAWTASRTDPVRTLGRD